MEPRDFWDRNSVLAEAFCASDERVRHAQCVLNEAEAERRRTLAAFAVTVGRDGTIADLMGLNEREVRTARRQVGRGTARTVAERLLSHATQPVPVREPAAPAPAAARPPAQAPAPPAPPPAPETSPAPPREEPSGTPPPHPPPPPSVPPVPTTPPQDHTTSTTGNGPEGDGSAVIWSSSMDSVLVWSWKSGLDLQTVAAELGLDVRTLLLRVQVLADDGLLTPTVRAAPQPGPTADFAPRPAPARHRSGRHRRHHEDAYTAFFSPTTTFPTHVQP